MILLFTDFSHQDPYIGQMHREVYRVNPGLRVVDLFHAVPSYNIKSAAYLLPQYCPPDKEVVYCCVVDPGVGSERAPIIVSIDGCKYVGPDNGLFEILLRRYHGIGEKIEWRPAALSGSFHGRDLFAPVAARLSCNLPVSTSPFEVARFPGWPDDLDEIVYIDHYGNAITGRRASTVADTSKVRISGLQIEYADSFNSIPVGQACWYQNSNGLLELSVNQGSTTDTLGLAAGDGFSI